MSEKLSVDEKIDLINDFAEEVITEGDLREIFEKKRQPVAYDGFEPSGLAPIHFGLLRATNLRNMLKTGVKFKLYLADYFAFINNKLGGDMENIRTAGEYFIEVWKACGIDISKVEVIWASEKMDGIDYWEGVLKVAKEISLDRTMRAVTIMGRGQKEKLNIGQLFYPPMQVNDIFYLDVDICQLGMDQRRANVLAREVAPKLGFKKPVAVHHHILLGLQGLQKKGNAEETLMASKMSKSDPKSAIYMHETFNSLRKKIGGAFCPERQEEGNPILEYCKYIIFKEVDKMVIKRSEKFGGDVSFNNYGELRNSYINGDLHPVDLKLAVAIELDKLIKPVREHFEKNTRAKNLYEAVKKFQVTR